MKKKFASVKNKFRFVIAVLFVFGFFASLVYVIYFYISEYIAQTSQTGSHQVTYTISSDNLNSAIIIYVDEWGNDVYNIPKLPFSVTYTMQDGDKPLISASSFGYGTLVCSIDVDEDLNWKYSRNSGKYPTVNCSGTVGEK